MDNQDSNWWGSREGQTENLDQAVSGARRPSQPKPSADNSTKKPMTTGQKLAAGLTPLILLTVIISVVVTMTLQRQNSTSPTDNSGTSSEDTASDNTTSDDTTTAGTGEQIMSTPLSSGTYTTTIGGKSVTYSAAYLVDGIDVTISGGTFASTTDDQVTFLVVNGGSLTIEGDVLVSKSGSENFQGRGDNYSFYGTNSVITVIGSGSSVNVSGATITSNVSGANAVVATNGATAVVNHATIATEKDNSRGLHATFGGTISADSTKITTKGGSSASLATDRGAGTVTAANMTLSTAGAGSPLIYSTGNITVTNSTGTATGAQIAVVEGKNSVTLQGCNFSATGLGNRNNVDNAAVMIYQSMSGDADTGTGSFTATDSTLTVLDSSSQYTSTPFFFITNTDATITLTGVTANFSSSEKFISALGTSEWGRSGQNGGRVTITATNLTATNTEVEVDTLSSVSGL